MKEQRTQSRDMRIYRGKTSKCELCGSRRDLQVHHIIPISCGGPDVEENMIVVCGGCHGRLTPHGLLSAMGVERERRSPFDDLALEFYKIANAEIERNGPISAVDLCDIFDSVVEKYKKTYKCTFRKKVG